jgi:hypothetical protein
MLDLFVHFSLFNDDISNLEYTEMNGRTTANNKLQRP